MRNIKFLAGNILKSSHLNAFSREQQEYTNLGDMAYGASKFAYGFRDLSFNQSAIMEGRVSIQKIEARFPSGEIISYDAQLNSEYSLELNVKDLAMKEGLVLYLETTGEETIIRDSIRQDGLETEVFRSYPKMQISTNSSDRALTLCRIYWSRGGFLCDYSYGTYYRIIGIEISDKINQLMFLVQEKFIQLKQVEGQGNLQILQSLGNLIGFLTLLKDDPTCYEAYKFLILACSNLLWMQEQSTINYNYSYNHNRSYYSLDLLLDHIRELLNLDKVMAVDLRFKDQCFYAPINNFKGGKLLVFLTPNNEEIHNWIINTQIASESVFEEVIKNRIPGLNRRVVYNVINGSLLVEIDTDSDYFVKNDLLKIAVLKPTENLRNLKGYVRFA